MRLAIPAYLRQTDTKKGILILATGFMVGCVRHGIEHHWQSFDTWEDFFVNWFVHTIAVLLFMAFGGATILWRYEFFFGKKPGFEAEHEIPVIVVITVLLGAIAIFVLAHWTPSVDDYD
jgi:hypothetical protein